MIGRAALLAALALVGGQLPSFSTWATLYVLGTGGLLIWLGRRDRARAERAPASMAPLDRAAAWWLLPAGLFAVLEATTYLTGSLTISLMADPLLEGAVGRSLGYFGWLAAFWWLVRR
ncbi:hypothetical protein [Phytohabitans rumicis]|uniref:Uncharacterized protein n=1 Tax=Phytohabitans rumicis TaxID=1076125 RepID=A0A6V8L2A7_9ACTN|nr:hypothetical protein [Phytohabitans rumicis]GFJ88951.1 hypothetical protein Prum_025930 [Phytohabitans rumicis]